MTTRDEALSIRVDDHRIDGTLIVPDARRPVAVCSTGLMRGVLGFKLNQAID